MLVAAAMVVVAAGGHESEQELGNKMRNEVRGACQLFTRVSEQRRHSVHPNHLRSVISAVGQQCTCGVG
jgi:hypothetical protein